MRKFILSVFVFVSFCFLPISKCFSIANESPGQIELQTWKLSEVGDLIIEIRTEKFRFVYLAIVKEGVLFCNVKVALANNVGRVKMLLPMGDYYVIATDLLSQDNATTKFKIE